MTFQQLELPGLPPAPRKARGRAPVAPLPGYLTGRDVAKMLNVTYARAHRLLVKYEIERIWVGGALRMRAADVERMAKTYFGRTLA